MISIAAAAAAGVICNLPAGAGADASTQTEAFSKRSVEIVALAAAKDDARLTKLIDSNAEFSLGAGDVGRPLGLGVAGAQAFAKELKAETYAYHGWDYIPAPRDGCSPQDVEVEFIGSDGTSSTKVKFHYEMGFLRSASGWMRSRNAGRVTAEVQ